MLVGLCFELVRQGVRLQEVLQALLRLEQARGCVLIRHMPQLALLFGLAGRTDTTQIMHVLHGLFEQPGAQQYLQKPIDAMHPALKGALMCTISTSMARQETQSFPCAYVSLAYQHQLTINGLAVVARCPDAATHAECSVSSKRPASEAGAGGARPPGAPKT